MNQSTFFLGVSVSLKLYSLFKFGLGVCIIFVILVFWGVKKNEEGLEKTYWTMTEFVCVYVLVVGDIAIYSWLGLSFMSKLDDIDGCS